MIEPPPPPPRRGRFDNPGAVDEDGSATLLILLGRWLADYRDRRGLSLHAAGETSEVAALRIAGIEQGTAHPSQDELARLFAAYDAGTAADRAMLADWARPAEPLTERFGAFTGAGPYWLDPYVRLERAATMIRSANRGYVPGLLQTADTTQAIHRLDPRQSPTPQQLERRVEALAARQHALLAGAQRRLWAVVHARALAVPLGGRKVHRRQLQHLLDLTGHPALTLQIDTSPAGQPGAHDPVTVFRTSRAGQIPDVANLHSRAGGRWLHHRDQVEQPLTTMTQLSVAALSPRETTEYLRDQLGEVWRRGR